MVLTAALEVLESCVELVLVGSTVHFFHHSAYGGRRKVRRRSGLRRVHFCIVVKERREPSKFNITPLRSIL